MLSTLILKRSKKKKRSKLPKEVRAHKPRYNCTAVFLCFSFIALAINHTNQLALLNLTVLVWYQLLSPRISGLSKALSSFHIFYALNAQRVEYGDGAVGRPRMRANRCGKSVKIPDAPALINRRMSFSSFTVHRFTKIPFFANSLISRLLISE